MLCLVAPAAASAGTPTTWTGGAGNGSWSGTSNWNPTANAPATSGTYSLSFGGTTQTTTNNDIGTVAIDSMSFTNNGTSLRAGGFTLSGNPLAFSTATITTTATTAGAAITDTLGTRITLSGSNTVTTGAGHNLLISGSVTGGGSMTYGGSGIVYLSGTNGYTGGTYVTGGQVQTAASGALGGNVEVFGGTGANVTVSGSGVVYVRNSSTLSNNFTLSGTGDGLGTLRGSFSGAGSNLTATVSGTVTLEANSQIRSTSAGVTGNTFVLSGPIILNSNTLTLNPTSQGSIFISGKMSGAGSVVLNGVTSGTSSVLISGSNDYSGGTTITSGTLRVGNSSALGSGSLAVNTDGLDLNGQALLVGALSGSSSGVIQSSVAGTASLTTTAATDSTYTGRIINGNGSAVVGLTKAGIGALTLTGSNTYTGPTRVNGGNLVVDNQYAIGSSGTVQFGGGTLKYTSNNNQVDYSSRIKTSGSAISIDTNGQNVTFASGIDSSNTGGLTKRGAGTLFINGSNSYTGNTVVEAGTLGGNGTIAGLVTVGTNAVISPGSTSGAVGTLSVGDLVLQSGATASMLITGTAAGLYDQISALNSVTYGGALAIDFSSFGFAKFDAWQLFSGANQSGHLSSVSATFTGYPTLTFNYIGSGEWKATGGWLAADQSLSFYEDNSHAIGGRYQAGQLVLVPEPSTFALMGMGIAAFGWRRLHRRRGMSSRQRAVDAAQQAAV